MLFGLRSVSVPFLVTLKKCTREVTEKIVPLPCITLEQVGTPFAAQLEEACLQLLNKNGTEWCREQGINYWDHPKEGWKTIVTTKRGTGMIWNNVISQAYQKDGELDIPS